nr:hypothetical protein [Deinococcus betulae]
MELDATLTVGGQESSGFKYLEMLGDGLAGEGQVVMGGETDAEFEESLTIARAQRIEDRPPSWSGQGVIEVRHTPTIGKSRLAYQEALLRRYENELLANATGPSGSIVGGRGRRVSSCGGVSQSDLSCSCGMPTHDENNLAQLQLLRDELGVVGEERDVKADVLEQVPRLEEVE